MNQPHAYPPARKSAVQDNYHGTLVPDPYRWLEEPGSEETMAWVAAQNALTRGELEAIPARAVLEARYKELWNFPRYTAPRRRGGRLFYQENSGLQNQPVLYYRDDDAGPATALLDPNELSADGTIALINYAPSPDGSLLAYSLAASGSDWQEIHILDIDSGQKAKEVIHWVKFTRIAWKHDNSGFYYSRYPQPGSMPGAPPSTHQRLYWHTLGTPQSDDVLVYARPDNPDLGFDPQITDDGQYLVLHVWQGTDVRNRLYYKALTAEPGADTAADEQGFVRLLDEGDALYEFAGSIGRRFYLLTDRDAPRGRIVAIDLASPAAEAWQEILPQGDQVLDAVRLINNRLVVLSMQHAVHGITVLDSDGRNATTVALPDLGAVIELSGRQSDDDFFVHFQSFLMPPGIWRYDFAAVELQAFFTPRLAFDAAKYETQQVFYASADGTRVPMFLVHQKGLPRDGDRPTLLYGYGGFAINLTPIFSVPWLVWLEQGGVVAVANMRGGNEYGEAWHQAGMLHNKQNVFDDFIAAAEWLIANDVTRSPRLAIMGRSNGGLLVAACMLQRPDLYGAVACIVPVADMLRYHRFTAGRYWTPEYGNGEENAEHFRFLYAYSPLHNVRQGVAYPPVLISTADTDDRVVPMHAKKFAATLQAAGGPNPVLLRVETKAGHGLGKPMSKVIEESADIYAFLCRELGVEVSEG